MYRMKSIMRNMNATATPHVNRNLCAMESILMMIKLIQTEA